MIGIKTLVKLAQKGDSNAFYELIEPHKEQLYKMAYSYFYNEHDALEAVQETVYKAYVKIKQLKKPEFFKTWLMRILIHVCMDELNKHKRSRQLQKRLHQTQVVQHTDQPLVEQQIDLQSKIAKMDPKYQMVIQLKYFQDLTVREIADILNKPEGTIKTWLHKALTHLRASLVKGEKYRV